VRSPATNRGGLAALNRGERGEIGEEGEGIYREVSCLDLVPGNGRNQEALMAAVSGEIDGRRLKTTWP
jgi:hypothetical protein